VNIMAEEDKEYTIIFRELKALCEEQEGVCSEEELKENKEIEHLRKIVMDVKAENYIYQTSV